MAITFDQENKLFTIQTKNATYQMMVSSYQHLIHVYYGAKIGSMELSYLIRGINRGFPEIPMRVEMTVGIHLIPIPRNILLSAWEITVPAAFRQRTRMEAR